jgi:hypothetical protein
VFAVLKTEISTPVSEDLCAVNEILADLPSAFENHA